MQPDAAADTAADAYEALMQFLYQAPIGLAQTSLDGTIEMANPMSAQLLMPVSPDGSLDNLFDVLARVAPHLRGLVEAFAPSSGVVCESVRIPLQTDSQGQSAPKMLSFNLLKLGPNQLMAMLSDITREVQREQQALAVRLSVAARMDNLTRMPKRAVALERLQRALAREPGEPGYAFGVLFINCDRFKQVNITQGRAVGDELLSMLADRLRVNLRSYSRMGQPFDGEPMAARMGGDEFVVVLDDLEQPDDAHVVAQRLLNVLAKPYGIGTQQLHCSVSMGIVLRAQVTGDANWVLQSANIAMVEAKRAGGGHYVVFEPAMFARAALRAGMETELRVALAEEQLFVVYQPVVGLRGLLGADGLIDRSAGVEALVRWKHPKRGVVPPVEFIGVAEETGLICALGDFVLATACRQFVQWQTVLGPQAPRLLAVNLSRAQLVQPDWVAQVAEVLRSTGMDPQQLQLEVTESLAAQDEKVQGCLHALKALGLSLALDDFGTGYSSLASLHQLPVDIVKIDRSFVCQADTSQHHRVLIEATVRVAHSLGMGTVAEGIETEAQADVVRALQCEKGQGYLFSRPLAADDLVRWIQSGD
ncbi:MAG: bifunctional diguanylate cyclase/phosphodiesterase [Ferruginibacter sp.]|nr:bifunctional diguanylate cyclase/phosphodiesterase [Rhodoferax sp.]